MKMYRQIFFGVFTLICSFGASAATYSWAVAGTVDRYYVPGVALYLTITGIRHNPAICPSDYYFVVHQDHPQLEDFKQMALTAKAAGFKLRIAVEKDECYGSYPKVNRMYLY